MSWAVGYDTRWSRDVGYGVPAYCDYPGCAKEIHRGLSYVCGGEMFGGEKGCGLYFCEDHRSGPHSLCARCLEQKEAFTAKPDHQAWIHHKMTDPSWEQWRAEKGTP